MGISHGDELERELAEALADGGYQITRLRSIPASADGVERRSGLPEIAEFVRNVLVFAAKDMDAETAQSLLDWIFAWIHTRRARGDADDVHFVSIYGPDNRSILLNVRVPDS
jgi:hypothetical protein